MDSASENEDLTASFLQHHQTEQYLLSSGVDEDDDDSRDGSEGRHTGVLREQDRFLPIANVARLMKRSIPKTGKIAKDARECVQECVSEFVSFITSEASDRCHQEKRKTINGEDILFAMSSLGFDNYVEPLKLYLQKYREANKGDKSLGLGEGSGSSFLNEVITTDAGAGGESGTASVSGVASGSTATAGTVVFTYDMNQGQQNSTGQNEFSLQ